MNIIDTWFSNLKSKYMHGIKVTQTDIGSHGNHWGLIFDKETDMARLKDRLAEAFTTGKQYPVNNSLCVITDPLIRGIFYKDSILTAFPYFKGSNYGQFEMESIVEWSHTDNLEAIIKVLHASGCGISFFVTDYAMNKNIYKTRKKLSINIVGVLDSLSEFDVKKFNQEVNKAERKVEFEENFCCFYPIGLSFAVSGKSSDMASEDIIEFIGRIQHVQDHSLGEIAGYLITVGLTPDFSMEFFIARTNLSIELEKNKHVTGIAWVQGTLEK